jgi:hypothetical protein
MLSGGIFRLETLCEIGIELFYQRSNLYIELPLPTDMDVAVETVVRGHW